jgi:hypothetical protein
MSSISTPLLQEYKESNTAEAGEKKNFTYYKSLTYEKRGAEHMQLTIRTGMIVALVKTYSQPHIIRAISKSTTTGSPILLNCQPMQDQDFQLEPKKNFIKVKTLIATPLEITHIYPTETDESSLYNDPMAFANPKKKRHTGEFSPKPSLDKKPFITEEPSENMIPPYVEKIQKELSDLKETVSMLVRRNTPSSISQEPAPKRPAYSGNDDQPIFTRAPSTQNHLTRFVIDNSNTNYQLYWAIHSSPITNATSRRRVLEEPFLKAGVLAPNRMDDFPLDAHMLIYLTVARRTTTGGYSLLIVNHLCEEDSNTWTCTDDLVISAGHKASIPYFC